MNRIRGILVAIALVVAASLSGLSLQGSVANAVASQHAGAVSASSVAGKTTRVVAIKPYGYCPIPGVLDC